MESNVNALPAGLLHHVFGYLDAKELCHVSATCRLWRILTHDTAANLTWKGFYSSRWGVTQLLGPQSWQQLYGSKMRCLKSWSGKYQQDNLYGHKAGVRSVKLLPSHDIIVTGSLDKTVRLWSLSTGMPIAASKLHGGTVRALALDPSLLASGSTEGVLRLWDAPSHPTPSQPLFDLSAPSHFLRGHTGPVATLSLTNTHLYSGSWDYSVRMWCRSTWTCPSVLHFDDWVWCVAARGPHLLVSAGKDVRVHDVATGQLVRRFQDLHEGNVSCLEGTHSGHTMFTGAADGLVLAHDLRMRNSSVVLWHHNAAVNGMSFEDPWLASASSDGSSVLIDTEHALRGAAGGGARAAPKISAHCRQLQTPGGPAYCVDLADQWMACGCESDVVRVWDFSKAAEVQQLAAVARAGRNSRRNRRRGSGGGLAEPLPTGAGLQERGAAADAAPRARAVVGGSFPPHERNAVLRAIPPHMRGWRQTVPRAPGGPWSAGSTSASAGSSSNSTPQPSPGTSPSLPPPKGFQRPIPRRP